MHRPKRRRGTQGRLRACTLSIVAATMLALICALPAWSSDIRSKAETRSLSKAEMRSLDQQVQDIKSDVLAIAAELRLLEEQLLHPSSTQVAVFMEIGTDQDVRLDAARVWIDGEAVAHHVYTHGELEALRNGGVQRLYTGNLREGEHALRVEVEGRRPAAGRFSTHQDFVVNKSVGPKKIGVTLSDSLTGGAQVAIADW